MPRTLGSKNRFRRGYYQSFARQFLQDHNIELYRGDDQILEPVGKIHDIKLPNTRYYVGDIFVERGSTLKVPTYEALKDMGWCVVSVPVSDKERWMGMQRVKYALARFREGTDYRSGMPPNHFVEKDNYTKQIRLVGGNAGPNGYGIWISLEEKNLGNPQNLKRPEMTYKGYSKNADDIIAAQMREWEDLEEEAKPMFIKEAAFMITDANEIICIPKTNDMPSILIVGMKGSGKSFCSHSLVSRFFWKPYFDYLITVLNDSSRETGTWCMPNNDLDQIYMLKRLNEGPLPLPTVYLHPMVNEDYEKLYMDDIGFNVTIPFKEIIDKHKDYLKIEGSARYFSKFKDQLKNCKNQEEAEALLDTISISFNVPPLTANKIRAELETFFDSGMTDISHPKQAAWRTSKNPEVSYNPLTACIHAGVIPILETEYVSNDPKQLSTYFSYFVKDLFNRQKQDLDLLDENSKLLLVVDEAHNISQVGTKTPADMLLRRCVREGRPRRIGTLLTTQKFSELPKIIKDNSTYLICFKNAGEASLIVNQYKLGKGYTNVIADLGKHECVAYTTEYFIVYDSDGNRRKSKLNEVFKGRSLPPYSMHKKPGEG